MEFYSSMLKRDINWFIRQVHKAWREKGFVLMIPGVIVKNIFTSSPLKSQNKLE
jgi:hypothetical protein